MRTDEFMRLCFVLGLGTQCFLTKAMAAELSGRRRRVAEEFGRGATGPIGGALRP